MLYGTWQFYETSTNVFLQSCSMWSDVNLDMLTTVVRKGRVETVMKKYKTLVNGTLHQ